MALKEDFETATQQVKTLTKKPSNDELLQMYSLYKQATEGDVQGKRPGMLDLKGRAKFDAWTAVKGKSSDACMKEYISVVAGLLVKNK